MPATSSAARAASPSTNRKCATSPNTPPPSMLTPARPSASPISARAPGRFSSAMARSNMGGSVVGVLTLLRRLEQLRQQLRHGHDIEQVVMEHRQEPVRLAVLHVLV